MDKKNKLKNSNFKIFPNFSPVYYVKNYKKVIQMNKHKKGKCLRCGKCCVHCFFEHNKRCMIYKFRPLMCRLYPLKIDGLSTFRGCGFK